jgi:hypothetical protein
MEGAGLGFGALYQYDEKKFIESLIASKRGTLLIPIPSASDKKLLSRFLAKVAIEALALRLMDMNGWNEEIVEKQELDPLRNYTRRGEGSLWPIHIRKIYPADFIFAEAESVLYEVLHEWTLLYTTKGELYFILCLLGNEYVINMGGRDLAGYQRWLVEHSNRSPLYLNGL